MSYKWSQNLVNSSKYNIKCPYTLTPKYICIHDTANSASAANEISYMISNNNYTSFHLAVDEANCIQGLPFERNAFAAGDGSNGTGNRQAIHIEICRPTNSDRSLYNQAEENAVYVAARMLYRFGLGIDALKRHKDFSGKNCPAIINNEGRWESFKSRVNTVLVAIKSGNCPSSVTNGGTSIGGNVSKPVTTTTTTNSFLVRIKCSSLNIRKEASFTSAIVGTVSKGQVFTIIETKNGLGRLKSGAGWISMGTAYVEKL